MRPALLLAVALAVPALAACTENAPADETGSTGDTGTSASARALTVSSSDTACDLSADEAPAGTLSFDVVNTGGQVTEFYLLGEDGLRIVGEVENIGPQLNRQLVVHAPAGNVRHGLQARHEGSRHPRRLHRDQPLTSPTRRSRSAPTTRSSSPRHSRTTPPTSRTSPTSSW